MSSDSAQPEQDAPAKTPKASGAKTGTGKAGEKTGPKPVPAPANEQVKPLAEPARMKRRHWGLFTSFVVLVIAPVVLVGLYLFEVSKDQFSSTVAFTVRQEEGAPAADLLGGLATFTGSTVGRDSDVLYEFIQSQQIVEAIRGRVDLVAHYSQYWEDDPVFSIWPDATIEDLMWFWKRVVRISYDQATGLIEVRILAFDPDTAQRLAQEIVRESQVLVNSLNEVARADAMRYAQVDLEEAVVRLKAAREAMTRFRTRTQIVDPEADIQGRMGVVNNLQQQLAEALIELDLLRETTSPADPRVTQANRRIEVIRDRIVQERQNFAAGEDSLDPQGEDYPTLIAEYESLVVDREFAERSYTASLAALEVARDNAARQSRYLAAYIQPTRAEESAFPQREMILGLTALLVLLCWAIMALIYYSIRDRR